VNPRVQGTRWKESQGTGCVRVHTKEREGEGEGDRKPAGEGIAAGAEVGRMARVENAG